MTEYALRHPSLGEDFSTSVDADTPEEAVKMVHSAEWIDLSGETEVYDTEDVPNPRNFVREEYPVGDAEPLLVVEVRPPTKVRAYRRLDGENEGQWDKFEIGQV